MCPHGKGLCAGRHSLNEAVLIRNLGVWQRRCWLRWRARSLNFFEGRHPNAFAEGADLKIKLILRRAFGCPNFLNLRLLVLVAFAT